jgi:plasmid stabilization system protein ParE
MKSFRLTGLAENDLFDIWAYIAARNETAADKLELEILEACARLPAALRNRTVYETMIETIVSRGRAFFPESVVLSF